MRTLTLPGYTTEFLFSKAFSVLWTTDSELSMSFADKLVGVPSKKFVAVGPGHAAITCTPLSASSYWRALLKWGTKAFVAA